MKMTITYEAGHLEVTTHFDQQQFGQAMEMVEKVRDEMERLMADVGNCPFYKGVPGVQEVILNRGVVKLHLREGCSVHGHEVSEETVQLPVYALQEALSQYFSKLPAVAAGAVT